MTVSYSHLYQISVPSDEIFCLAVLYDVTYDFIYDLRGHFSSTLAWVFRILGCICTPVSYLDLRTRSFVFVSATCFMSGILITSRDGCSPVYGYSSGNTFFTDVHRVVSFRKYLVMTVVFRLMLRSWLPTDDLRISFCRLWRLIQVHF